MKDEEIPNNSTLNEMKQTGEGRVWVVPLAGAATPTFVSRQTHVWGMGGAVGGGGGRGVTRK